MAEDEQSNAQRNSNLARIRDNQRRSRARRKEYLQELETKYRACETSGVEASAEIQAAARKVISENQKLRQLLKLQGLSDEQIETTTANYPENAQYPNAATELVSMLNTKRPCRPSSNGGSSCDSRQQSSTPSTATPFLPQPSPDVRLMPALQPAGPLSTLSGSMHATTATNMPPLFSDTSPYTMPGSMEQTPIEYHNPFDDAFDLNSPDFLDGTPAAEQHNSTSTSYDSAMSASHHMSPSTVGDEGLGGSGSRNYDLPNEEIFRMIERYAESQGP